jgi:hypothetical protein
VFVEIAERHVRCSVRRARESTRAFRAALGAPKDTEVIMRKFVTIASVFTALGCQYEETRGISDQPLTGDVTSPENPYPDSPTNSPPPAASCGDMNGGGDQHVDFDALMAAKIEEKRGHRRFSIRSERAGGSSTPASWP